MVSFSFLIYSFAISFFILDGTLFNGMDTILVIGLGMSLVEARCVDAQISVS